MRDIKRIKRILGLIESIWERSSDLRFGQMLINLNLVPDDMRVWSTEDDAWEKHLMNIEEGKDVI